MAFKLPKYSDLTNQQRSVVNLPVDGNHLIGGAPGTGKTVVAIYRASDAAKAGKRVLLLVYNRPLMLYIKSAVESLGIVAEVDTCHNWLSGFYKEKFGCKVPLDPEKKGQTFEHDWPVIKSNFSDLKKEYGQIILDEAQDVPLDFIKCLTMISRGVTCCIDPNQSVDDGFAGLSEVANVLNVKGLHMLTDNFRNSKGIYDFAKVFKPKPKEGVKAVKTINPDPTKPKMIQCSGAAERTSKMVQVLRQLYGFESIGVFVDYKQLRKTYNELCDAPIDQNVYMYKTKSEFSEVDFDRQGIFVLSYGTMKGLEFDAVLLPTPKFIPSKHDDKVDENLVYVAVTRASKRLYGFYVTTGHKSGYIDFFGKIRGHEDLLSWE